MNANITRAFFRNLLLLSFLAFSELSFANSGAKDAGGGGGNVAKLDAFTVNLANTDRYLQVVVTLKVATAEVAEQVKVYMPMVRHGMLLILSSKDDVQIKTADGKRELIAEIREKLNKVLKVTEHDGVTDIFFESFVIQ
jgi:flagellar FliL protein